MLATNLGASLVGIAFAFPAFASSISIARETGIGGVFTPIEAGSLVEGALANFTGPALVTLASATVTVPMIWKHVVQVVHSLKSLFFYFRSTQKAREKFSNCFFFTFFLSLVAR